MADKEPSKSKEQKLLEARIQKGEASTALMFFFLRINLSSKVNSCFNSQVSTLTWGNLIVQYNHGPFILPNDFKNVFKAIEN